MGKKNHKAKKRIEITFIVQTELINDKIQGINLVICIFYSVTTVFLCLTSGSFFCG